MINFNQSGVKISEIQPLHNYTNPKSETVPPVHPKSELSFEQLTCGSRSWKVLQSCRIMIENWPKELQNQPAMPAFNGMI